MLDVPPTPSTSSTMERVSAANHAKPPLLHTAPIVSGSESGPDATHPTATAGPPSSPETSGPTASRGARSAAPSAFAMCQAPRPSSSFSVTTAQQHTAVPSNSQGPAFDRNRAMSLFARPPSTASSPSPADTIASLAPVPSPQPPVPPVAAPTAPPMAAAPLPAHLRHLRVSSGHLETIMSQDLSWPPSIGATSISSLHSANSVSSDGQGWDR